MKQTIFITGASSGIGASLAVNLAKQGCNIGLFSRNREKLERIKSVIDEFDGSAIICIGDVRDQSSLLSAYQQIEEKWGFPDIVIANAGIINVQKAATMPFYNIYNIIDTNLKGVINTIQLALPKMIERQSGHIVGIASSSGFRGIPNFSIYSASKAGIIRYLESVRVENKKHNIRVTIVCPGFVKTPMVTYNVPMWFPTFFIMDVEDSTKRILKAIEKKTTLLIYPFPILLLAKLSPFISDRIYGNVILRFARWFFRIMNRT